MSIASPAGARREGKWSACIIAAAALMLAGGHALVAQAPAAAGFGPPGGNVYVLAADPSTPGVLYAGTQRGVFKSTDGGSSWVLSASGLPPTRVQSIAVDPRNPEVVWAGTRTPGGVGSVGIFRSTDGGATWLDANVGLVDPFNDVGPLDVDSVAVSPADSSVILAGTVYSEIFLSADGGVTWGPATLGGNSLALATTAIVFDPATPTNVYAASTLGLLKSADGGASWSRFGDAGVSFYSIAIDPTSPTTLYAGDPSGTGIWKSTNGGGHWTSVGGSLPGSSGAHPAVLSLAVDPAQPATVYAATYGSGVFVSHDGGATWSAAGSGMRDTRVASLALSETGIHAGTYGGGVWTSGDGAQSWTKSDAGLEAAVVGAVLSDPSTSGLVYAGTTNGVAVSATAGSDWSGPGAGLPPAPVSALALATAGGSSPLLAGTLGSGLYRSTDHGATWTAVPALNDTYVSSLAVDPAAPGTVFAGTGHPYTGSNSEGVFKSTDGGTTWRSTSLDAGQFSVDFLGVRPGQPQVFAGSNGVTGIFRSLDGGSTWSTITTGSCGGLYGVAFDSAGSTIYLAGTAGVCRSADGGATWTASAVGGGLSVQTVLADPVVPSTIYAGTAPDLAAGIDGAVFVSTDGGATFTALEPSLPPGVASLAIDPALGIVYAGTAGEGVAPLHLEQARQAPATPSASRRPPRVVAPR